MAIYNNMKKFYTLLILLLTACSPRDGEYVFKVLTTNDVHGRYFDSTYVAGSLRNALVSASWAVDSVRHESGRENVILIDVGDCLQGDNAAYYFNFVDTLSAHLYPRMAAYMGYDAVVVGNHDIETGHSVYDRLCREMKVPFLAANAISVQTGKPYFQEYALIRRHGLKIAVIGFTNPGIPGWLAPELWSGMEFRELLPYAQEVVDRVESAEKPDIVIVAVHGGTGEGALSDVENPGLALFESLRGVDLVLCAHDHRPVVHDADSVALVNSGSHCRYLGQGIVRVKVSGGRVVEKSVDASLIPLSADKADERMREAFAADYEAVKAFTLREVGSLEMPLRTVDAYGGMSGYLNLLHTLSLRCSPAQISFAAPLTFAGEVPSGVVVYNDLFTIYPYENQLFVLKMTGREIVDYLEYSYDGWINTFCGAGGHVLKIANVPDPRTGQTGWSFTGKFYNFDSAGGLVYEVDVTRAFGERVTVKSMADGSAFDMDAYYNVAMTSYRANGGGGHLSRGAGIAADAIGGRVVARYPEIRQMLYDYFVEYGAVTPDLINDPSVIGYWRFVPSDIASEAIDDDLALLFR